MNVDFNRNDSESPEKRVPLMSWFSSKFNVYLQTYHTVDQNLCNDFSSSLLCLQSYLGCLKVGRCTKSGTWISGIGSVDRNCFKLDRSDRALMKSLRWLKNPLALPSTTIGKTSFGFIRRTNSTSSRLKRKYSGNFKEILEPQQQHSIKFLAENSFQHLKTKRNVLSISNI